MSTMSCPRCDGEIEYETETVDNGDGVMLTYATSYVSITHCMPTGYPLRSGDPNGTHGETSCGCVWTLDAIDQLDERATKHHIESAGAYEP